MKIIWLEAHVTGQPPQKQKKNLFLLVRNKYAKLKLSTHARQLNYSNLQSQ